MGGVMSLEERSRDEGREKTREARGVGENRRGNCLSDLISHPSSPARLA